MKRWAVVYLRPTKFLREGDESITGYCGWCNPGGPKLFQRQEAAQEYADRIGEMYPRVIYFVTEYKE